MNVTVILIAVNLVVFGLQAVVPGVTGAFALTPAHAVDGAWWRCERVYVFKEGNQERAIGGLNDKQTHYSDYRLDSGFSERVC